MLTKTKPARSKTYLDWIRRQPCAATPSIGKAGGDCVDLVQVSHHGDRGMGQKCSDYRTIPLCRYHHMDQWHAKGSLFGWPREITDQWIAEQIIVHLERYILDGDTQSFF